jgi:drug/metabolite transporter (DMT)-like permease
VGLIYMLPTARMEVLWNWGTRRYSKTMVNPLFTVWLLVSMILFGSIWSFVLVLA